MKTHTEQYQESHSVPKRGAKLTMIIKIFCYLIIFTAMGAAFTSCAGGYVASEPAYDLGYDRPLPPSETHIWIEGNWIWDRRTHNYIHQRGYWEQPRAGRSYRAGHWESGPRGKYWSKGYWERVRSEQAENNRSRRSDRDRDRDHDRDHK